MPELRWILLAVGVLLIAGLWWWESRRPAPARPDFAEDPATADSDDASAPAELQDDSLDDDDPAWTDTVELEEDVIPPIVATRPGRPGATRDPPIIDIPADADPELTPEKRKDADIPPMISYREMGEELARNPFKLRGPRHMDASTDQESQPWVRTQPMDRFAVMGEPRPEQSAAAATEESSEARPEGEASAGTASAGADDAVAARKKIVAIRLIAAGGRWPARSVVEALQAEGLSYGKYSIFHMEKEEGQSMFFVANMVEPGSFDMSRIDKDTLPGISVFAVVPGPVNAALAFDAMLSTSRRLAESLAGQLQDEHGSTLTAQRVLKMRDELLHFEQQVRRAQRR